MRRPLDQRRFNQTATVLSLPAPTGGWNERNTWANMEPLDAIEMINFIPEADCVRLRNGDTLFAEGLEGDVETLCEFEGLTGRNLLAGSGTKIFDITAGTVEKGSGFTNARWQCANFNNRLFLVNGDDEPQAYDGTTLGDAGFTGVGLTPSDLNNVSPVRIRLWFTEKDSGNAWYSGIGAITGTLTKFEVLQVSGAALAAGGKLLKVENWSRDAGRGMDDFTVFVLDTGELLVYEGDPATDFTLIGKYRGPAPVGSRCTVNQGGELIIITRGGFIPMTAIMSGFGLDPNQAISEKIRQAVSEVIEQHGSNFGFEAIKHPNGKWLVFNIPINTNQTYEQYIFNLETVAWCQFQGRNARTFGTLNNELYFGGFGQVFKADDGLVDESNPQTIWDAITTNWEATDFIWDRDSSPINGRVRQAFNSLDQPDRPLSGTKKLVTGLRPFVRGGGNIALTMVPIPDFKTTRVEKNLQQLNPSFEAWDDIGVLWDDWDENWEGNTDIVSPALNVGVFGETISVVLQTETGEELAWYNTEVMYKPAGIFD